jgi:hypothetical protein
MSATRSPMMTQGAMVFPVVARGGVADLAAQFDGGYRGLQIVGVRQHICLDLHRVARVWAGQTDMAAALWPDHAPRTASQHPAVRICLRSPHWTWEVQPGRSANPAVQTRVALREEGRRAPSVARRERLLVLPDTVETRMVLQVLTNPGKVLQHGDAVSV